jgi:hypothetical protein
MIKYLKKKRSKFFTKKIGKRAKMEFFDLWAGENGENGENVFYIA